MSIIATNSKLAHLFQPVKPDINSQLPLFPDSMIHHNVSTNLRIKMIVSYITLSERPYGVSSSRRILSPQLLFKKFDYIRDCLQYRLGFTTAQREVVLRLLTLWAHYGYVYPKESMITSQPGCSKATFWRTTRRLRDLELVKVINRYVIRPHAQISNLYILDKLCRVLARYLADHGSWLWGKWLEPVLQVPDLQFWSFLKGDQLKLPLPDGGAHTVV